ncbi:MAG: trans-aconitate 2-methyltransferase [Ruminococcaceae bacterium]|nr:trans-aconitate 2-methyltransferase [Oscillospiraceae bacterium]
MHSWNATTYLQFKIERTRPAVDLASRIPLDDPKTVLDIGCGPGNSTAVLRERFPNATIIGIDNAPDMIAKAKEAYPDMTFFCIDVDKYIATTDERFDVVFSNACLQWLPDHKAVLPKWMGLVKEGGVLAVQMPNNYAEPIHRIIEALTTSDAWRPHFHVMREKTVLSASEYYDCLVENAAHVDLWETAYYHTLSSHQDLLEWYRGTGLRPYLEQLNDTQQKEFEADFLSAVKEAYPIQADGTILFRFPRLFFVAAK